MFNEEICVGVVFESIGKGVYIIIIVCLFYLFIGGDFIDLLGICEFGFWYMMLVEIEYGFWEICDEIGYCKFCNCWYLGDFGCVIDVVVDVGKISFECLKSFY